MGQLWVNGRGVEEVIKAKYWSFARITGWMDVSFADMGQTER